MKIFTNGCFDLLHIGHIELLKYSKSLGDYLVVGINSDNSVKKLKGSSRPINNELTRKIILESIKYVDEVIVFDEDTPIEIIKKIQPNYNWYCLNPKIGKQSFSWSDIENDHVDYDC